MDIQANSLDLQVAVVKEMADALDETVKGRAVKMLRTVLEEQGAQGEWRLIFTGHGSLPGHQSQYWMEPPVASEMLTGMVQIAIRSRLTLSGTILCMLRLPKDADRKVFLGQVSPIIKRFNDSHWQGVVEREERESLRTATRVGMPVPRSPRKAIRDDDDDDDEVSSRKATHRPTPIDGRTALALAQGKAVRVGGRSYQSVSPRTTRVPIVPLPRAPSARARVQPGLGAELARQGFTPWLGALSTAPVPQPSPRERPTMDQTAQMSQAVTIVRADEYPPETIRRAKAMLAFLLDQAALPSEVTYPFQATGAANSLDGIKDPFVMVTAEGGEGLLSFKMRSRGAPDGTLSLSLALPDGLDRADSLAALKQTASNLNKGGGWQEPLDNLGPAPADRLARSAATGSASSNGGAPPPTMPPASKGVPMTTNRPLEDEGKLVRFLIAAVRLPGGEKGVVSTGVVGDLVKTNFPTHNPKTIVGPVFSKLKKLGHVLHVGHGQFQVTQAFANANRLGIQITALPEYHRDDTVKKASEGNGAHHEPSLAELLQKRQAIDEAIREATLREHATRKAEIADLENRLEEVRAGLLAFEEEHATLLAEVAGGGEAPAGGSSPTAVNLQETRPH